MGSIGVYTHTHTLTLVVQRVHTYTHTYSGGPAANASPVAQMVKNPPPMQETGVRSLGCEDPLEKGMATHSSILRWYPGELHGQRSLVGYSPWGRSQT